MENQGAPFDRAMLSRHLDPPHALAVFIGFDNFIVRLRRYIEPELSKPRYLKTVRGLGYQLVSNPDSSFAA